MKKIKKYIFLVGLVGGGARVWGLGWMWTKNLSFCRNSKKMGGGSGWWKVRSGGGGWWGSGWM